MLRKILTGIIIISGIAFVGSILLMSPKWGVGFGIWGASSAGGGDYSSKKSVEGILKKVAIVSIVIFLGVTIILPYV